MDDYMWTTEGTDGMGIREEIDNEIVREIMGRTSVHPEEVETINDDDARTLMLEQMRRRVEGIQTREREAAQVREWQGRERDLRNRLLRADWPEPTVRDRRAETEVERRRETIGFLHDFIDGKEPKKKEEKILKPLPDELFEI